ncbi:MAG: FHA domain-containing protein [Thermoanaerobaculia bacterium]
MAADSWRYILSVDGRDIELTDGEVTLGRSRTATVRIDHESVSRSHALLTFERGQAVVKDLNSSNGTYVGGRRVLNETRLADGDRIQLGAAIIGFRLVSPNGPSDRTALIDEELLSAAAAPPETAAPEPQEASVALALEELEAVPSSGTQPEFPAPSPVESPGAGDHPLEISAEELINVPAGQRSEPAQGGAASALEAVRAIPSSPPPLPAAPVAAPPRPVTVAPPPPVPPRHAKPVADDSDEHRRTPPKRPAPRSRPAPPLRTARPPDSTLSQVPLKTYFEPSGMAGRSGRDLSQARGDGDRLGTPENVAGFLPRLAALFVDVVVLLAINILLLSPIFLILFFRGELQARESGPDMALVAVGILCSLLILAANLWYVVGGWAKTGRTPGKSLLGLAVISDRSPAMGIGWSAAFTRCIGALLSALPLGMGYWVVLFRRDRRSWHDQMAGTWVVRTR